MQGLHANSIEVSARRSQLCPRVGRNAHNTLPMQDAGASTCLRAALVDGSLSLDGQRSANQRIL